jgi:hypothetical protein
MSFTYDYPYSDYQRTHTGLDLAAYGLKMNVLVVKSFMNSDFLGFILLHT